MGLKTPEVNGARQELPCLESPEVNGARQDVAAVKKFVNGAWQEIWSAIKYMAEQNNTLPEGAIVGYIQGSGSDHKGWAIWYFEDGDTGGGSVTYYLDGEFNKPAISFDYDGFFGYIPSDSQVYASVGKLELYTRAQDGAESYTTAVGSIKVTEGQESFSKELSGTFDRVGFRFTFQNWNVGADMMPQYLFNIYNIFIDGKECLPSEDCVRV